MNKQMRPKDLVKADLREIELSYTELINSKEPLTSLSMNEYEVMLAYKISKPLKELDKLLEGFYEERKKVLDSLGTLDKETNEYKFEGEKEKEASIAIQQMLDTKVVVKFAPIYLSDFKNNTLPPRFLALLDWLIIE